MMSEKQEDKKDPWEGHRVSRPIPLEEEIRIKEKKEKEEQPNMFNMFGNDETQEETKEIE